MPRTRSTLRTSVELAEAGLIALSDIEKLAPVAARYAVAITPAMADLIDADDAHDPIARQFVPSLTELEHSEHDRADPIGDARHSPVQGIVHRYPDRVLLKLTHLCPVYCRFCFRREMVGPGKSDALDTEAIAAALRYIRDHEEIWEVVLTGGDPFMLSARRIAEIAAQLGDIAHVKILRWHTRVPVVDPPRVTETLMRALKKSQKTNYVVLHANHPRELTQAARAACARIVDAGIPMLHQGVLLKGVNDSADILEALMRALVEARVKPYYLHHLDLAPGTEHFRTSIEDGQELMRAVHARASGLCQPAYVLDIPGGYDKARLQLSDLERECKTSGQYRVRDAQGCWHDYPPLDR